MTAALCVVCDRRRAVDGQLACHACPAHLADTARAIVEAYGQLDATPGASGPARAPGSPGFGSRAPVRLDVLDLQSGRGPVVLALRAWADEVLTARFPAATVRRSAWTVASAAEFLTRPDVLDWLAGWWRLPALVRGLDDVLARLRRTLGLVEPLVFVGYCPEVPDQGGRGGDEVEDEVLLRRECWDRTHLPEIPCEHRSAPAPEPCGGRLYAKAYGQLTRCRRCRQRWNTPEELETLGQQLGGAWLDLAGLERYFGRAVPISTLRVWAHRDGWPRRKQGRRTLYSLPEARASFVTRRGLTAHDRAPEAPRLAETIS